MRDFLYMNTLLFRRKSAKFVPNCRNVWAFLSADTFINEIFMHKYCYFAKNWRNLSPIVKIRTFLVAIFQMKIFVCLNTLFFYWRSAKFAIFCCIKIFFKVNKFLNALFFFMNTLLIHRKSAKFETNYRNMNFPSG